MDLYLELPPGSSKDCSVLGSGSLVNEHGLFAKR